MLLMCGIVTVKRFKSNNCEIDFSNKVTATYTQNSFGLGQVSLIDNI